MSNNTQKSFGPEADAFLEKFYKRFGATTPQEKMNALGTELDGTPNFYAMGGEVDDEMKLACLEYEYLDKHSKIKLVLA